MVFKNGIKCCLISPRALFFKKHSTIKMTPLERYNNPEKLAVINSENNYYNETHLPKKSAKFKVGDRVRLFRWKNKFEKGFRGYFTE